MSDALPPAREDLELVRATWPAPARVRAVSTTRRGGCSRGAYASLNLGARVEDAPADVKENRRRLRRALGLTREPAWLHQVHGTRVIDALAVGDGSPADASTTDALGVACAILTADCIPVALCNRSGTRVAAAHAGWRGLAAGVLDSWCHLHFFAALRRFFRLVLQKKEVKDY